MVVKTGNTVHIANMKLDWMAQLVYLWQSNLELQEDIICTQISVIFYFL